LIDALRVQPWRGDDADATSSAAGHLRGQGAWSADNVMMGRAGVDAQMVRCPRQYDDLMRRAGAVWEPGAREWPINRRRVIRELEYTVDPMFRRRDRLP
jgi:hypothetical protein